MDSAQDEFITAESTIPDGGPPRLKSNNQAMLLRDNFRKSHTVITSEFSNWRNFDASWDPKTTTKQKRTDRIANRLKDYVDRRWRPSGKSADEDDDTFEG
ncbi:hypothetical protein E4U56_004968 [Claviceps arundinis]|uniref:Uncharacterized protein n=1 Tax=Claviceps arundinis TaxID=1623583 RepID=A0A9P7MN60_9HYPO|nr:hypothetical protein E4U56_004968 [Claviceps arundinis]